MLIRTTFVSTACCLTVLTACEARDDNTSPSRNVISETTLVNFDFSEDIIVGNSLTIGPNSLQIAYVKYLASTDEFLVMINQREIGRHENTGKSVEPSNATLTFSPDGTKLAYVMKNEKGFHVYVNGVEGIAHDEIIAGPIFSPDSVSVAYAAIDKDDISIILDGARLVTGAIGNPALRGVPRRGLLFSPDSKKLAYYLTDAAQTTIYLDGEKKGSVPTFRNNKIPGTGTGLAFSPDSSRFAFLQKTEMGTEMILDGERIGPFYGIATAPVFSPSGNSWALIVMNPGGQLALIRNGSQVSQFDSFKKKSLRWSADNRLALFVKDGNGVYSMIDGQRSRAYDDLDVGMKIFGPHGKRVVYGAQTAERWSVILDGRQSTDKDFDGGTFTFSPDGELMAYVERRGKDKFVNINDGIGDAYAGIFGSKGGGIVFDTNREFHYIATKEGARLLLVRERISSL